MLALGQARFVDASFDPLVLRECGSIEFFEPNPQLILVLAGQVASH